MMTKLMSLDVVRRNAILNAALKEFVAKGFDKASTNVIAKEAGISKQLMFHYVVNKQTLFLDVYDYFTVLLDKEYFKKMDFSQKDIFDRLRQSYRLQVELIKHHPCILYFSKLSTVIESEEMNQELDKRAYRKNFPCNDVLFDTLDESKFRKELNLEKCKQFIFWANVGFTDQLLKEVRETSQDAINSELILKEIDEYLDELIKIFYISDKS